MISLQKKKSFDDIFYDASLSDFLESLGESVLYDIEGEINDHPIFISTLLHGNELSGIIALRNFLKTFRKTKLPRRLILLLGNIGATKKFIRKHDDEPDFNRIWDIEGDSDYHKSAQKLINFVKEQKPIFCIDLHNNTGKNPYYACVNKLDLDHVYLAKLFSETVVYFTEPHEVMSVACSKFSPALTIEAGVSEESGGLSLLDNFFKKIFQLESLKDFPEKQFEIYHTFAKLKVEKGATISFEDPKCDLLFRADLDEFNFIEQGPGVILGKCRDQGKKVVIVDSNNNDITDYFLNQKDGEIILKKEFIPSMFTKNIKVIHQDCLGYLMEKCTVVKD